MNTETQGHGGAEQGATLIEALVAMGIGLLVVVLAFTAARQGTKVEGATSKEAQFAMQQALLYEYLLNDLHSSFEVKQAGPHDYVIRRYVDKGGAFGELDVSYKVDEENQRITRAAPGEKPTMFDFNKILPERMKFQLQLEKLE